MSCAGLLVFAKMAYLFVQMPFLILSKINSYCPFDIYRQKVRKRGKNADLLAMRM